MKRILYLDTYSTNNTHEMFNASSLKMIANIYDNVEYRAAKSSKQNVSRLLKGLPPNIHYNPIFLPNWGTKSIGRLCMQIVATITNIYYILTCKEINIIINYNTAISLYPINWAAKVVNKKILVICHGEMQDLEIKRPTSLIFKKSMTLFSRSNIKIAKGLYFGVLGESILKNVENIVSKQIKEKLISFNHTAIFDSYPLLPKIKNKKLTIGMTGNIRESKGLTSFLNIAKHFKENPYIEFRVIGYLSCSREYIEKANVIIPKGVGSSFLSREEMYNQIQQLDYAIYLFPKDGYKYTASGSVFDAIDCERPIISLHNDYIDHLFKLCGDFGYLANDTNEMIQIIEQIIQAQKSKSFNFKKIKQVLSPKYAAEEFTKTQYYIQS